MMTFSELMHEKQKQSLHEKVCSKLERIAHKKGFIMYFCLNGKCYASTEDDRIRFNNLKSPIDGTMRVEDFEAINLDDLVNGKDNTEIIEKDQVDKVKVIDLDKICKILSSKYKIFVMPK
jgi:hypothetical protein